MQQHVGLTLRETLTCDLWPETWDLWSVTCDMCVFSPFSDCHQVFNLFGANVVTTFSMRWPLICSLSSSYGVEESHTKHFFSSWLMKDRQAGELRVNNEVNSSHSSLVSDSGDKRKSSLFSSSVGQKDLHAAAQSDQSMNRWNQSAAVSLKGLINMCV